MLSAEALFDCVATGAKRTIGSGLSGLGDVNGGEVCAEADSEMEDDCSTADQLGGCGLDVLVGIDRCVTNRPVGRRSVDSCGLPDYCQAAGAFCRELSWATCEHV